jgi:hypothetical protein
MHILMELLSFITEMKVVPTTDQSYIKQTLRGCKSKTITMTITSVFKISQDTFGRANCIAYPNRYLIPLSLNLYNRVLVIVQHLRWTMLQQ